MNRILKDLENQVVFSVSHPTTTNTEFMLELKAPIWKRIGMVFEQDDLQDVYEELFKELVDRLYGDIREKLIEIADYVAVAIPPDLGSKELDNELNKLIDTITYKTEEDQIKETFGTLNKYSSNRKD